MLNTYYNVLDIIHEAAKLNEDSSEEEHSQFEKKVCNLITSYQATNYQYDEIETALIVGFLNDKTIHYLPRLRTYVFLVSTNLNFVKSFYSKTEDEIKCVIEQYSNRDRTKSKYSL